MAFDITKIPSELIDNFKQNRGGFFVGAGLSMGANLPDWKGLMIKMIEKIESMPWADTNKVDEYNRLISDPSKYLLLAEELKSELGDKYFDVIEEIFAIPDITPTPAFNALIEILGSIIITLNYDKLIENAYIKKHHYSPITYTYTQAREAANLFWKNKFFILKAHGDAIQDIKGIILSQKDYRKTIFRENGYKSLIQSIFTTKSLIFLGISLNDPEFNLLLDYLHDSYHGGGPTHYILLEKGNNETTILKRYSEDFNIQTIEYNNPTGDYIEIEEFLIELKKLI